MPGRFDVSTHSQNWLLTEDAIRQMRQAAGEECERRRARLVLALSVYVCTAGLP
eukprot:SAG25_NODE_128_length_14556_cov_11.699405_7_plen_54_part_00